MKKIIKVASILGIATLVKIFAGAARAKFLAWQIGPVGLGLIGQALMYSVFTIQLCTLNLGMGITKYVSENLAAGRRDRIRLIVDTAGTMQFLASAAFILIVLPFSGPLAKFVFSDGKYWPYLAGITLVTPFAVYMTGMTDPVFYGFQKIADYTRLMVTYTVAGLGLLFALVYFYKSPGMLAQIILIAITGFAMSRYFLKKKLQLAPGLNFRIFSDPESRNASADLFRYGIMSFVPGTSVMFVVLYLRGLLMKQYGIDANGYYHVAYAVSAYYLPLVTNAIWGYFYPELCALKDNGEINRQMNQFIRFVLFSATAIAAGAIIFRRYIILVLFSSEFMKAYDLIAIQAVGDVFYILFCVFSTSLMARKKFLPIIFIATLAYNAFLISSYFAINGLTSFGYESLNLAIAFTNIAFVVIYLVYSGLDTGFRLSGANSSLFLKSAVLLVLICMIPGAGPLMMTAKIALSAGWLAVSVTKRETRAFAGMLLPFLKRNRQ